jgi:hypothetical protein
MSKVLIDRKTLQQVLDALESRNLWGSGVWQHEQKLATKAVKAALAAPLFAPLK